MWAMGHLIWVLVTKLIAIMGHLVSSLSWQFTQFIIVSSPAVDHHAAGKHSLQWRHNGRNGVSNHQPHDGLLKRLFGHSSKKTSYLHVTGLCVGNSRVTDEFPTQRANKAESVSIWWRHHANPTAKKARIYVMLMNNLSRLLLYHISLFYSEYKLDIEMSFSMVTAFHIVVAYRHHMVTEMWFNTGSGNGLFPDSPKVVWHSPESKFTASVIYCLMSLKIIFFKLLPHLPGANELKA